VNKSIYYYNDN